jgi:hypothetical protein|tara:strand:+ start:1343 stop:1588 length:246 start_codon:yes stop_codon:yes gene_type:complete
METIYLDNFITEGILKEKIFRQLVGKIEWSNYKDKRVLIKGCTSVPVPTWAYLIITAQLSQYAKHILYGEPCATVKIFTRD